MKQTYITTVLRIGLVIFLLISSAAIVYTTDRNFRSVQILSIKTLDSTAVALSFSAETALRSSEDNANAEIRDILSDRVVAYAMIIAEDGNILFHTNPHLAGSYLLDKKNMKWPSTTASGTRINLRTGLPAYEFDYLLHPPDGSAQLLRLVLYTTSADNIVSDARKMWWAAGIVLMLLWTAGIMLERMFTRRLRLQEDTERRSQLALIGQMTAVLAHEIRNALGSIKGYVQWVHEKLEKPDPKKEGLAIVLQGVKRIESLVNDLLCFSRDEQYRIESLEPAHLISEAINATATSWKGTMELVIKPDALHLMGDKEKLYQVILNGMRNAIQAMKEDGNLWILVSLDGRWVKIRIKDTGPGIPTEAMPRLFTPFYTTKTDGTGLGLAYSKKVIEGMGGRIALANRKNRTGAVLTIRLPKGKS